MSGRERRPDLQDRRRFRRAAAWGTAAGTIVVAWMVTAGTFDLLAYHPLGDFYDAQAHSWLDGRWDISIDVLRLEAFFRFDAEGLEFLEGNWDDTLDVLGTEEFFREQSSYMYQGPVPALFRVPIAAVTDRFDGRLTAVSMLVAAALTGWLTGRLSWAARRHIRPHAPVSRAEAATIAAVTFLVVGGSTVVFLASNAWVYNEAILWGAALCLAALLAIIRYVDEPSWPRLVVVGTLVTATVLTRASIGFGPLLAVVAMGVGHVAREARLRWLSSPDGPRAARRVADALAWMAPRHTSGPGPLVGMVTVVLVATASYAAVNYVKFRTLLSVPFEWQFVALIHPPRQEFFEANGSFFGLQFVPTTTLQYLRPDGVRFSPLFPWVEFPPAPGPVIGGVEMDLFDRTSSLPASMPLFVALGIVVAVAVLRRWLPRESVRSLVVPLIGAAAAGLAVFPFGYISNRYLGDFLPLMVLAGAVGIQVLLRLTTDRRAWRRPAAAVLALTGAFGLWVNVGHGLLYQRLYSSAVDPAAAEAFIETRDALDHAVPGGDALPELVRVGEALPDGSPGDLFILGGCDALYVHAGADPRTVARTPWVAVERTPAAGRFDLSVRFAENEPGRRVPVMSGQGADGTALLVAETTEDGQISFQYVGPGLASRGAPHDIAVGTDHEVVITADPRVESLAVVVDDRPVFETIFTYGGPLQLGRNVVGGDAADVFDGTIEPRPAPPTDLCDRLLRRSEQAARSAGSQHRVGPQSEEVLVGEQVGPQPHAEAVEATDEGEHG